MFSISFPMKKVKYWIQDDIANDKKWKICQQENKMI